MTYAALKSDIADILHRSDLTGVIPSFIARAEARLNRTLQLRSMETEDTLYMTPNDRTIALPIGVVSPINLWIKPTTIRYALPFRLPKEIHVVPISGIPEYWTVDNDSIAFDKPALGAYEVNFRYYKAFSLSDSDPTNWLITNAPDLYLYASLLEAAPYIRDMDMMGVWQDRYERAKQELLDNEHQTKALAPLVTDIAGTRGTSRFNVLRGF